MRKLTSSFDTKESSIGHGFYPWSSHVAQMVLVPSWIQTRHSVSWQ